MKLAAISGRIPLSFSDSVSGFQASVWVSKVRQHNLIQVLAGVEPPARPGDRAQPEGKSFRRWRFGYTRWHH